MQLLVIGIDAVAIAILAGGIYFRHYRRREVLVALLGINAAVLAVTIALTDSAISMGLGLGLFGVLSIIRLRSSEISHAEIAYYFVALAMGLLAGVVLTPWWLSPLLIGTLVAVMGVADHPAVLPGYRQQTITIPGIHADESELREQLQLLLGAEIKRLIITRVDIKGKVTHVDVRYRVGQNTAEPLSSAEALTLFRPLPTEDPSAAPLDPGVFGQARDPEEGS